MSTMVAEVAGMYRVSTVVARGKQRKIARGGVLVPQGDPDMLKAEIIRQAKAARLLFGVNQPEKETVE